MKETKEFEQFVLTISLDPRTVLGSSFRFYKTPTCVGKIASRGTS